MAAQSPRILGFQRSMPEDTAVPAPETQTRGSVSTDTAAAGAIPTIEPVVRSRQFVPMQDLGAGRSFVHPLYVAVEQNGEEWLALSADLGLVGVGESELDALDDLRSTIAELFDSLVEMRAELGPALRSQLAFLERLSGPV